MIDQIALMVTGTTAIWLSQDTREHFRKWASVFGLMGQPFWFYTTWQAEQWGIFTMCFLYTFSWIRGFKNHWLH